MNSAIKTLLCFLFLNFISAEVFAQRKSTMSIMNNDSGQKNFAVSLTPISYARESNIRVEYNPDMDFSFALEGIYIAKGEELFQREIEESNGDSLMINGGEVALYIATYSNQADMSGFYWTIGAGYRNIKAKYRRSATDKYAFAMNKLNENYVLDEDSKVTSNMSSAGTTAHFRGGYRFVSSSYPFIAGVYLGIRHFQGKFKDVDDKKDSETQTSLSPSSSEEREGLKRRLMSKFEPGLEMGLAF